MFSASVGPSQKTRIYRRKKRALGRVFSRRQNRRKKPWEMSKFTHRRELHGNHRKKRTSQKHALKTGLMKENLNSAAALVARNVQSLSSRL